MSTIFTKNGISEMDIDSLLNIRTLLLSGNAALYVNTDYTEFVVDIKEFTRCDLISQDDCNLLLKPIIYEICLYLRKETGQGMMDCKSALTECDYDIEKAKQYFKYMHRYTI